MEVVVHAAGFEQAEELYPRQEAVVPRVPLVVKEVVSVLVLQGVVHKRLPVGVEEDRLGRIVRQEDLDCKTLEAVVDVQEVVDIDLGDRVEVVHERTDQLEEAGQEVAGV